MLDLLGRHSILWLLMSFFATHGFPTTFAIRPGFLRRIFADITPVDTICHS